MFESSLIISTDKGQKTRKPMTLLVSTLAHVVLLTVLILMPLVSYSDLPRQELLTFLVAPPPPPPLAPKTPKEKPPDVVPKIQKEVRPDPGAVITPTAIPKGIADVNDLNKSPSAGVPGGIPHVPMSDLFKDLFDKDNKAIPPPPPPPPPPLPVPPQRIRVGGNVQQANLVSQVKPQYPPLAKQARIQGVVVLEATIGKDGAIKDLRVVSGHPLLTGAAIDAVKQWVYKPTLLNGEPVEVITTITVNFAFSQ